MMLTTKGRYAVMAVVDIANQGHNNPVTLADVAGRQGITVAYLEQIVAKLRISGLLKSVRGPGGGYRLSKDAQKITVAHVINAIDEPIKMTRCSSGVGGCVNNARCMTHSLWSGLGANIYSYLNSITIEDICSGVLDNKDKLMNIKAN